MRLTTAVITQYILPNKADNADSYWLVNFPLQVLHSVLSFMVKEILTKTISSSQFSTKLPVKTSDVSINTWKVQTSDLPSI